ncbi:MAG: hypothetical protein FVQ81_11980 [Candidatus Glassbacteria bacterium]|nr:hypothetical protein [Candidatus Glassbacteria bacterium]
MASVELIYDNDCPNVTEARAQLLRAFTEVGMVPHWTEWERSDQASPDYVRSFGSPTILVDGKDIAGVEPSEDISCCRLYGDSSSGLQGVPPVRLITSALRAANGYPALGNRPEIIVGWRSSLTTLPGLMFAFLPNLACPACWPAYTGLLGSLGFGFLLNTSYLFPITLLFLVIAVGALGFRAEKRWGYGPFGAGLLASGIVLVGKFVFESDQVMYGGIALFVAASVWNGWPRKTGRKGICAACVPAGTVSMETGDTKNTT